MLCSNFISDHIVLSTVTCMIGTDSGLQRLPNIVDTPWSPARTARGLGPRSNRSQIVLYC